MATPSRNAAREQAVKKHCLAYCATSLDGYLAGPGDDLTWLGCVANPENDDFGFSELLASVDALVMGRRTYDVVRGFGDWPYTKPVFVWTSTPPDEAQPREGAQWCSGSPERIVQTLSERELHRVYVDGGQTVRAFLEADLLDEITVSVIPILLGGGIPLFAADGRQHRLQLEGSELLLGQIVRNRYRVLRDNGGHDVERGV